MESLGDFRWSQDILEQKLGGYKLLRILQINADCVCYEGQFDAGEQALVYVYEDAQVRDRCRTSIHGFQTSFEHVLNTARTLYVILGEYRVMMPDDLKAYLMSPERIGEVFADYKVLAILGAGYKGVTYKVRRADSGQVRTAYALKLTIAEEYAGTSYLPEVDRMADLAEEDRDHFPQIHWCQPTVVTANGQKHPLIVFVEDLIPGMTLDKYLARQSDDMSAQFLDRFVREMLSALAVMQQRDLMHDDLHAGNIMIRDTTLGMRPCLIDFGSTKPRGDTRKPRDDIRNLGSHIATIANILSSRAEARSRDEENVVVACESLLARMNDDDPLRRPEDARELLREFQELFPRGTLKQTLKTPFDFGNAEEVMDNGLLQKLAAKSFPWRGKIESSANLLLIGPRGCGKTTVFRSMSFTCLADAGKLEEALKLDYVGLYVSCTRDFRQQFSAMDRAVLKRREREIRHYFNLLILREFLSSLVACCEASKLTETVVVSVAEFVREKAFLDAPPQPSSAETLNALKGLTVRHIDHARMAIWHDESLDSITEQSFIADLADFSSQRIPPFQSKTLYLFIDDYTDRKVPREAQKALNHILFVPNGIYKAKISSEVFGVPQDETFGAFLDQDRDYKELNLGTLYYTDIPRSLQKAFLKEIVDNRLELCKYQGRVDSIIGDSEYKDGTLSRSLKVEYEARQAARVRRRQDGPEELVNAEIEATLAQEGSMVYYHGWDTICNLCTGDVSNILELLDRMYSQCQVNCTKATRIPAAQQDSVIQSYSRQYIGKIKGIPKYGEKLFQIVEAFGTMIARLLREYPWLSRGVDRKDPFRMIRIELDEGFVAESQSLVDTDLSVVASSPLTPSQEASVLWMLLQRHSLFIDAEKTRSRRNTLASKAILRRVFCPAFRAPLVSSESFTVDKALWQRFCFEPSNFARRYVRDRIDEAKAKAGDATFGLFKETE